MATTPVPSRGMTPHRPTSPPIRYFADFTKPERLAVRHAFRGTSQAFEAARAATNISGGKGDTGVGGPPTRGSFYNHGLTLKSRRHLVFSDSSNARRGPQTGPHGEALQHHSDPTRGARPARQCQPPGGLELLVWRPMVRTGRCKQARGGCGPWRACPRREATDQSKECP